MTSARCYVTLMRMTHAAVVPAARVGYYIIYEVYLTSIGKYTAYSRQYN